MNRSVVAQQISFAVFLSIFQIPTVGMAQSDNPSTAAVSFEGAEPSYCDPAQFSKFEVKYSGSAPLELHIYKVGKVTLAGMAVGNSAAKKTMDVALAFRANLPALKYCTWYFNDGNNEAESLFRWIDLPRPISSKIPPMVQTYVSLLKDEFHTHPQNFVSCAVDYGYIGEGCNGMSHRGPTVFAMILAYSGCTPSHSVQIANSIWGAHGISVEMREAIAAAATEIASQNPHASKRLRDAMESNNP